MKIIQNQLLNKFLCNNCTLYESTDSSFVKRKTNWEIALMVNFASYITMACKCIMHFLHGAGSQYLVDTNKEQVFILMPRPSTIFPLLRRSCDVGDRCAEGVRDREKRKRERQAMVLAFIVPFNRPPIQHNSI